MTIEVTGEHVGETVDRPRPQSRATTRPAAVGRLHRSRIAVPLLLLGLATLLVVLLAVANGPVSIPATRVIGTLVRPLGIDLPGLDASQIQVLLAIRLPRVLLGLFVGAALAVSGTVLQGLFRNPLVDPGLIGVSTGGALGAALMLVFGAGLGATWPPQLRAGLLPLAAFAGGWIATLAVYRIAGVAGRANVAAMLLAGIAVNALNGSGIGLLSFLASDAQLRSLTFWSFGGLGGATWGTLFVVGPPIALATLILARQSHALNAFLLGETEAGHLGFAIERVRLIAIACSALAVGAAVAVSGVIGFVGLVVPHLLRLMFGSDHRLLLPGSALLGALLVTAADLIARTVLAPAELPIGIVTAAMGAPFFLVLLVRDKRAGTSS